MKYLIQHFLDDSFNQRPDAVVIKQGQKEFTFAEVNRLARQFARQYQQLGLKKGDMIGLLSRVRVEAVAAMIAALRSGIVYVPLNIHAPSRWVGNITRKSGISVLLVDPEYLEKSDELDVYGIQHRICLGDSPEFPDLITFNHVRQGSDAPLPETPLMADDLAYILYTSGSTGDPKGILITHRNAFTFIDWMGQEFDVNPSDRVLSRAPLQFDLSVFDIFTTMSAGGCLVIPEMGFSNKPQEILELMRAEKITIIYTVPSAYIGMLTKADLYRNLPSLRLLLYAGEPFPTPYLRRVMECLPNTKVSNIYGPTETNIVTYYHLDTPPENDEPIPIGMPVHDTEAFIVDENLNRLPDGEVGEILIRGGTVFAGYFNDPELTRKRLIQSPFHGYPTLCCRTGDYGRILPDGNIAYHGRMDNMVKTRGYRVELGEVESAISACAGVEEVAVIPKPHEKYGNSLHAYVGNKAETLNLDDLKASLEAQIPAYMVPFEFIRKSELPKTATGKIDRVRLTQELLEKESAPCQPQSPPLPSLTR